MWLRLKISRRIIAQIFAQRAKNRWCKTSMGLHTRRDSFNAFRKLPNSPKFTVYYRTKSLVDFLVTFSILFVYQTHIPEHRHDQIEFCRTLTRAHPTYFDFYSQTGNGNVRPGATGRRYLTAALFNAARYIFHVDSLRAMSGPLKTKRNEKIVYHDCGIVNREGTKKKGRQLILFRIGCGPAAARRLRNARVIISYRSGRNFEYYVSEEVLLSKCRRGLSRPSYN